MPVANSTLIQNNLARWKKAHIVRDASSIAKKLDAPSAKDKYKKVEAKTSVPWFFVAVTHMRESSQNWGGSLAQGDPWNKKSVHVPAGRGPFNSWEEAAIDALMNCAPYAGHWRDWSVGGTLAMLEKYNGVGYANRGLPSPYVWSWTDQYTSGKYVADGRFDPNFKDPQPGCAAMIMAMAALDADVKFGQPVSNPRPTAEPPKEITNEATKSERNVRKGAVVAGGAGAGNEVAKTTVPDKSVPVPSYVAYNVAIIAVIVVIIATVLIAKKVKSIKEIW